MFKGTVYYIVGNNGDGSATPYFYADEKTAKKAYRIEENNGEGFTDNDPIRKILVFDSVGKLSNPDRLPYEITSD